MNRQFGVAPVGRVRRRHTPHETFHMAALDRLPLSSPRVRWPVGYYPPRCSVAGAGQFFLKGGSPLSRVAVFIDGGDVNKIVERELRGHRLDFLKFSTEAAGCDERLWTYYDHCPPFQSPAPTPDEPDRTARADAFYTQLTRLPRFEVRKGRLQKIGNTYHQKKVDFPLAIDLVHLASTNQIQRAVLVTGDSDLVPAVEVAKFEGVVVDLYHHPNSVHRELFEVVDDRHLIDDALISRVGRSNSATPMLPPPSLAPRPSRRPSPCNSCCGTCSRARLAKRPEVSLRRLEQHFVAATSTLAAPAARPPIHPLRSGRGGYSIPAVRVPLAPRPLSFLGAPGNGRIVKDREDYLRR